NWYPSSQDLNYQWFKYWKSTAKTYIVSNAGYEKYLKYRYHCVCIRETDDYRKRITKINNQLSALEVQSIQGLNKKNKERNKKLADRGKPTPVCSFDALSRKPAFLISMNSPHSS